MTLIFALSIGIIFGAGTVLVLTNDLVRVTAGIVLISQAAVLVVVVSGLASGRPPVLPAGGEVVSDPLVQAMALTAIVIGFAVIALLLAIVARVRSALNFDLAGLARDEAEETADLERTLDAMHEELDPEEAAEEE